MLSIWVFLLQNFLIKDNEISFGFPSYQNSLNHCMFLYEWNLIFFFFNMGFIGNQNYKTFTFIYFISVSKTYSQVTLFTFSSLDQWKVWEIHITFTTTWPDKHGRVVKSDASLSCTVAYTRQVTFYQNNTAMYNLRPCN